MTKRCAWAVYLVLAHLVIALDLDLPVLRPALAIGLLLGLPTLVLYRRAGFPSDSAVARGLYAFGSSLLGLILLGLALNATLPPLGVDRPLQPLVLGLASLAVNVALLLWRADRPLLQADWRRSVRRLVEARFEVSQTLAGVSLVLAVLGAVRLNNGAGGHVALAGQLVAGLALLALLVLGREDQGRDLRAVALVATSLLLATSLRGWHIVGHDIQSEYVAFLLTNENQQWRMGAWQNAYNACLSVNILPSVLTQTTGLSGVVVFKLVLQLVFALVPGLTYLLSRRYLSRRLAMVATTLTMGFPTFFNDMPYLVRQEIAFFFLGLFLLAATEPGRAGRATRLLAGFFGVGVVLSHYSTTYVLLIGLVFGLGALGVSRLLARRFPDRYAGPGERSPLVLLSPALVVFLALVSWAWAGPLTHTGGHASEVARSAVEAILGKGDNAPGSSDRSYGLFARDQTTPRERLDMFVDDTMQLRQVVPPEWVLIKHPGQAETRPRIEPASTVPLTPVGQQLASLGADPTYLHAQAKLVGAALIQIFLIIGLVWLVLRRKGSSREVPEELACLSLGAVAALGLIVLIPKLSVDYGVLRAFQQTLLVVAPVTAMGLWVVVRKLAPRLPSLSVAVPVGLLLTFTGVVPALLGGYPGRLALSNAGLYYDRHYASDSEVRASTWLAKTREEARSKDPIVAKKSIGYRIVSTTLRAEPVADRLFPTLLTKETYVFVDAQIMRNRQSTVFYTGDHITYDYPMQDLDRRLNLVYSSQQTRIYR